MPLSSPAAAGRGSIKYQNGPQIRTFTSVGVTTLKMVTQNTLISGRLSPLPDGNYILPSFMLQLLLEIIVHPTVAFRRLAERGDIGQALGVNVGAVFLSFSFRIFFGNKSSPFHEILAHLRSKFLLVFFIFLITEALAVLVIFLMAYVINWVAKKRGAQPRLKAIAVCSLWAHVVPMILSGLLAIMPAFGSWKTHVLYGLGSQQELLPALWAFMKAFLHFTLFGIWTFRLVYVSLWATALEIIAIGVIYDVRLRTAVTTYILTLLLLALGLIPVGLVITILAVSFTLHKNGVTSIEAKNLLYSSRHSSGIEVCFDPIRLQYDCMRINCIYRNIDASKDSRLCEDLEQKQNQHGVNPQYFVTKQDCLDRLTELTTGKPQVSHGTALRVSCSESRSKGIPETPSKSR